jgi:hypothetical protein
MAAGASIRRRVLIVVSAWCPAMIADMQRARMLAWEMPALGWDVEILTPRASEVRQDVVEPDPDGFFAPDTPVHEVGSSARAVFEALGSRTHSWRTVLPMLREGSELLRSRRFDLVYFTTTTFVYFRLGPYWRRKFGVPFVLDFHDPWLKDDSTLARGWKSQATRSASARMERTAVEFAAGIVSVSPHYVATLERRYGACRPDWLAPGRHAVIPFGARDEDIAEARRRWVAPIANESRDIAIRYVGAGGTIMARSFRLLCRAIAALRSEGDATARTARIGLFGTTYNWKPGDATLLENVARSVGLSDLVGEHPERVSFRHSLELLLGCDGALVLGVDDDGYMPSKIFGYALPGKPLLASVRRDGPAYAQFESTRGLGHALWFDRDGEMPIHEATNTVGSFLRECAARRSFDRYRLLEPFLAPAMAQRHADLFDACVTTART